MTRRVQSSAAVSPLVRPDPWQSLKEIDLFFAGADQVHQTMRRLVRRLAKAAIPHVIVGGMAVHFQGYRRTTDDVDVLLTPQGLDEFKRLFVPKRYQPHPKLPRRFTDRISKITVDILVTGLYPGSGKPGPISYPDPTAVSQVIERVTFLDLPNLIQLKLAARRHQDFADVVNLIKAHELDESYAERLHKSIRADYIECLEEKRREEEYLERNG